MKFTLAWLKEHLETTATLDQIAEKLTAIGLEVESVQDASAALAPFIVAEIIEAVQHPGADKLRVCKVNDGTSIRQVVCGAPNARAGIKVVLATEGVKIPANGMVIKKSKIRDFESNGMLCSAAELGLGADGGGIIELPATAKIGESVVSTLGVNDPVIDIAITPNRADCLGVRGVARDLAAAGLGSLIAQTTTRHANLALPPVTHGLTSSIGITLGVDACPLFIGCHIKGVKNGPSPEWLQQRLKAIGLRPISTLVDITNFMTFGYGRPLHVFDAGKLKGNLHVRYAKDGETLHALNDKDYTLTSNMVAVCDESGVIGLGGVIGGTSTGCDEATTDVFLEAALFDPAHVARTGRALSIESDARYRFERGIDPAFVKPGIEIATSMIVALCGGTASELVIAGSEPNWKRTIQFHPGKVESLGGVSLSDAKITEILTALGFEQTANQVLPPSWRADIEGEADLVEEILRINGYDNIPSTSLPAPAKKTSHSPASSRTTLFRKTLATRGLSESYNWAFLESARAKQFGGTNDALTLLNPINAELDTMRPSLLPHLIAAAMRNAARGFSDVALFEIGNIFEGITLAGHKLMATGVRAANANPRNHFKTQRTVDVFDVKADLFALLAAAGLNPTKLQIDRNVPAWYHPTRSGRISLGGKTTLGYFGELHPLILSSFDSKHVVAAFEVFMDAIPLPRAKGKAKAALSVSNFQSVERDFAFVGTERIAASDIVKAIEAAEKQLIQSVNVFDIYTGKGVEPGMKSVAVSVILQASDRTLTEAEIEAVAQKIILAAQALGFTLRQ